MRRLAKMVPGFGPGALRRRRLASRGGSSAANGSDTAIRPGRYAATVDEPVVVFLIGMKVHRFGAIREWLPSFRAMQRMRRELDRHPELGLLHTERYLAVQGAMLCQYWRSIEDLERFAHGTDLPHLPAWREFNRRAREGSPSFGLWLESYVIEPGRTEAIYTDMAPTGLGAALGLAPARGARLTAARRMGRTPVTQAPPLTDYDDHHVPDDATR